MPDEGGRQTPEAFVIAKTLDYCKSPVAPVGYPIVGKLEQSTRTASKVNMTSQPAFTTFSRVVAVIGNASGVGGGLISNVNLGMCRPIEWSQTVKIEGHFATMNTVEMWMNCLGPEGPGNVLGTLVYVKCTKAATVTPSGEIVVEEPKEQAADEPAADSSSDQDSEAAAANDQDALDQEEAALQQEIRDAEEELAKAEAEAARLDAELAFELAQLGVDAAGTIDPTPTSDAISAGMSISKGDYLGATLSGISMIPYLGDAFAKPLKLGRAGKVIAKLKALLAKLKTLVGKLKDKLAKLKDKLAKLRKPKRGGASKGGGRKRGIRIKRAPIKISEKQLQKKFDKHAKDFGVEGNYNKENASKFKDAINGHVSDGGTQTIQGTYRNAPCTHHYNPNTGLNVVSDPAGNFVSGWKLSPAQTQHVTTTGRLGGG